MGSAKRRKKDRKRPPAVPRIRRRWSRSPVERPHSTKKGAKGYDRRRDKQPPDIEQ